MNETSPATGELDRLLDLLDEVLTATGPADSPAAVPAGVPGRPSPAPAPPSDAIDAVRETAPRLTTVRSVRHDPMIQAFRRELTDGLIRADAVGRILRLVSEVIRRLLPVA